MDRFHIPSRANFLFPCGCDLLRIDDFPDSVDVAVPFADECALHLFSRKCMYHIDTSARSTTSAAQERIYENDTDLHIRD
jgi:hypothetical protein